jgi:hypothetical protein
MSVDEQYSATHKNEARDGQVRLFITTITCRQTARQSESQPKQFIMAVSATAMARLTGYASQLVRRLTHIDYIVLRSFIRGPASRLRSRCACCVAAAGFE